MPSGEHFVRPATRAIWYWAAIFMFAIACAAGPIGTSLQSPFSGDEHMAAAINAAIASGILFGLGFIAAVIAFRKEKNHRVLCWLCGFLYLVVPVTVALYLSIA
jgi:uncharacterized membrane-anchored protein